MHFWQKIPFKTRTKTSLEMIRNKNQDINMVDGVGLEPTTHWV